MPKTKDQHARFDYADLLMKRKEGSVRFLNFALERHLL
jgi:hypothetical protein